MERELGLLGNGDSTERDTTVSDEKIVWKWFQNAVEIAYREYLGDELEGSGIGPRELAAGALLARSNLSRQESNQTKPSWRTYLLNLARVNRPFRFHRGQYYVRCAMISVTERVAKELLNESPKTAFSTVRLEVLESIYNSDVGWKRIATDPSRSAQFLSELSQQVSFRSDEECQFDVDAILDVLEDWDSAYRYFHECIGMKLKGWEY